MKYILSILALAFLVSCGKDKTATTLTTTQKLQYKWNLLSIQDIEYVGASTTVVDTVINYGLAGDYVEFNANGKAYFRIAGSDDTVNYNVVSDTQIMFDGDPFTINSLTATDMVMTYYGRETNPVHNWDNVLVMKR